MPEPPDLPELSPEGDGGAPSLGWEVPEKVAVAVLIAVAALVVGGVATGIARGVTEVSPFPGSRDVWNALQFSVQWANIYLGIIVLGVLGPCWWQLQAWAEVIDDPDDDDVVVSQALGHMRRARQIAFGAHVALCLAVAGSVAGFVADLGTYGNGLWALDITGGAQMLAVVVIGVTGTVVARQLRRGYTLARAA